MSSGDLAALVTACGVSLAGILTAVAALISARNNAARVDVLQEQIKSLKADNERLKQENDDKTTHNYRQDAVIVAQQSEIERQKSKIEKWFAWSNEIGRVLNQQALILGMYESQRKPDQKTTAPLPPLPAERNEDE